MTIRLSDLPHELRRRILQEKGPRPPAARTRRAGRPAAPSGLMRVCSCRCEIFRPDGVYPETCDGCGQKFPGVPPAPGAGGQDRGAVSLP